MVTNTFIFYKGYSLLDNKTPIVVLLTGINFSRNKKTGNMLQTHILIDDGTLPSEHVKSGSDAPICGDCKYRGGNGCYVKTYQSQNQMYRAYLKNRYRLFTNKYAYLLEGRLVRIGSYGDPAAVPMFIWTRLMQLTAGWTCYTHQWNTSPYDASPFSMASTDTYEEALQALDAGYRIFHVATDKSDIDRIPDSIWCPATPEGGEKTTCVQCRLCSGNATQAKNILAMPHGANWVVDRALKVKYHASETLLSA